MAQANRTSPDIVVRPQPVSRRCCDDDCMRTVARTVFNHGRLAQVAGVLAALGDETRLKMVQLLTGHEALCVCELQQAFDLGQPTISHHLRILREAGIVDVVRRGTWAYYSLRRETLQRLTQDVLEAA